jgi:hypothetical protein
VTVLGRAVEMTNKQGSELLAAFLRKHPHLESFARLPSTALCAVEVETYVLVTRFQHAVDMKVSEWSSSNLRHTEALRCAESWESPGVLRRLLSCCEPLHLP